jgi:Spy/CpxP family protein refolding chaperone
MNAHKSLWLALPLALLGQFGCNNGSTTADPEGVAPTAVAETPAAPVQARSQQHARSIGGALFRAATSLELTSDQQTTVQSLKASLHADSPAAKTAGQALHTALVAGVRAGSIDVNALQPLQAAVQTAHQAHAAREAAALNGLYAVLTATQRQELVATVRANQAERAERWAEEHEQGVDTPRAQHLAHLTELLALDTNQQLAVSKISVTPEGSAANWTEKRAAMKAQREALLTAFASDSFDATKLAVGAPEAGQAHGQSHAAFLAQLVPVLTAAQRETLAASMESHQHE